MKQLILLFFLSTQLFAQTVLPLPVSVIDSTLLMANFVSTNNTIEISNVNIMANDSTIGIFQGFSDLPVTQGIILSTGGAEWGVTGGNQGVTGPFSGPNPMTNPYLQSLISVISQPTGNVNMNNFICIEFDFKPHFDAINFEYIFASTEYQNFTCSEFNDVFGFFLTGPGISGTYYNNSKNLAVIPGSNDIPVCINSINAGVPSGSNLPTACFYVDSNFQNNAPLFNSNNPSLPGNIPFPFNGYTESLSIIDSLIPDSTYHLKMVISDIGDNLYNSAVFLSANSFTSYQVDSNLWGCTDSTAINYNGSAIFDDSTCVYQNVDVYEIDGLKSILSHISNPILGNVLEIPLLEQHMEVVIYDSRGNRIIKTREKNVDISNLNSGIYILEINDGTQRTSGKFIKQ